MISESSVRDFIEENIYGQEFEGCSYYYLDDTFAIVFAWDNEGCLYGKLAYNIDDLQSDYDYDWYMPNIDGSIEDDYSKEIMDTELVDCTALSVDGVYDHFINDIYIPLKKIRGEEI